MKKGERIESYVQGMTLRTVDGVDSCYLGYFQCFNAGQYYEAHDVLEHLWLSTRGPAFSYYKGLIQLAGAFVHLRKQYLRPDHPKDGRRLRPAERLFDLAASNLRPFAPVHIGLDLAGVLALCHDFTHRIRAGNYLENPWSPAELPQLELKL